jgi:hypothetical protein
MKKLRNERGIQVGKYDKEGEEKSKDDGNGPNRQKTAVKKGDI